MLIRLKTSLRILAIAGTILSLNSKASAQITLAPNEFDFYADKYIRFKSLQVDTAISAEEIKALSDIIKEQSFKSEMDSLIIINKDKIVDGHKEAYEKLSERYDKQLKKNKRLKGFAIGSVGANVVLVLLLVILL